MDEWKKIWRENFTSWKAVVDFLQLSEEQKKEILQKNAFPLSLPRRLAEKIEKGRLDDPILRQFLPLSDEEKKNDNFSSNPVGDWEARCGHKLLKKYKGRALLIVTAACVMHCRFCFRRHFDYASDQKGFE